MAELPPLVHAKKLLLKNHPQLRERWVQERIAEDPSLLDLGDVVVKDKERRQPHAGRLDLLLQDADSARRYEVELQLGKTDESHIIRTIEYWDLERKRYPQYEHCAVIIAEDITSRFLNIVGLFNGFIPIIALQLNAFEVDGKIALTFAKIVDELQLGLEEEDEGVETVDRAYWEQRGTHATMALTDQMLKMIHAIDPQLRLKYNKFYIGLASDGQPNNFALFRPKKNNVRLELRLEQSEAIEKELEQAGLDVMDYDKHYGRYRIRITKADLDAHEELIQRLMRQAYDGTGN